MSAWPAPWTSSPIRARIEVPGSKSETARALYLAAVASQDSTIRGALRSRDTDLFAEALRTLGADISSVDTQTFRVTPIRVGANSRNAFEKHCVLVEGTDIRALRIDCGLAGTVMRFLPPLAALCPFPVLFDGDQAAYVRPLAPLLNALSTMGAHITYLRDEGHLPFVIRGPLSPRSPLRVDASASSQFLSALLLAAPLLAPLLPASSPSPSPNVPLHPNEGSSAIPPVASSLTVEAIGSVVSRPHIEMTAQVLRESGISCVSTGESSWQVEAGRPRGGTVTIAPDLSNAGPFLAAAMLCGGRIEIPHWPHHTTQPGGQWPHLLRLMGATVFVRDDTLICEGPGAGKYDGLTYDMSALGELTPTLAAIALFARTPSTLTGIAHLRGHETDRLAALVAEIRRLGGDSEELTDGLVIRPRPLRAADLRAYEDHRMATFGAIVGLCVPGVTVDDIGCTSKTLPDFVDLWERMLAGKGGHCGA